jgi:hypothetical protein
MWRNYIDVKFKKHQTKNKKSLKKSSKKFKKKDTLKLKLAKLTIPAHTTPHHI